GGYEVHLVLSNRDVRFAEVEHAGVAFHYIDHRNRQRDPYAFIRFFRIARELKPDLIHSWGVMATVYAIPASRLLGIPLVSSLIADAFGRMDSWVRQVLFRLGVIGSDVLLSNSHAGLIAYGLENHRRAKVIHNGVRMSRFSHLGDVAALKKELGIEGPVVIMAASTSIFKDYDLFLDVAKLACKTHPNVSFLAVGG